LVVVVVVVVEQDKQPLHLVVEEVAVEVGLFFTEKLMRTTLAQPRLWWLEQRG